MTLCFQPVGSTAVCTFLAAGRDIVVDLFNTAMFLVIFSTIFSSNFMILLKASSHETSLFFSYSGDIAGSADSVLQQGSTLSMAWVWTVADPPW